MKFFKITAILLALFLLSSCAMVSLQTEGTEKIENSLTETTSETMDSVAVSGAYQDCTYPGYETLDEMAALPNIIIVRAIVTDFEKDVAYGCESKGSNTYTLEVLEASSPDVASSIQFWALRSCFSMEVGQEAVLVTTLMDESIETIGYPVYFIRGGEKKCLFSKDSDGNLIGTFMDDLLEDAGVTGDVSLETVYDLLLQRREAVLGPLTETTSETTDSGAVSGEYQYNIFHGYGTLNEMAALPEIIIAHAIVTDVEYDNPRANVNLYTLEILEASSQKLESPTMLRVWEPYFTMEVGQEAVLVITPMPGSMEQYGYQLYIVRGGEKKCLFSKDSNGNLIGTFMDDLLEDADMTGDVSLETVYDLLLQRREAALGPLTETTSETTDSGAVNGAYQDCSWPGYETLDEMVALPEIIFVRAVVTEVEKSTPSIEYNTVTLEVLEASSQELESPFVYLNWRENFSLEDGQEVVLVVTPVEDSAEQLGVQVYISRGGRTCLFSRNSNGNLTGTFMDELLEDAGITGDVSLETVYDLLVARREAALAP